jgi:hypothetical protein
VLGRRHPLAIVTACHSLNQQAAPGITWDNCRTVAAVEERLVTDIESQVGLAVLFIGPVATPTSVRQNRPHIPIESDVVGRNQAARRYQHQQQNAPKCHVKILGEKTGEPTSIVLASRAVLQRLREIISHDGNCAADVVINDARRVRRLVDPKTFAQINTNNESRHQRPAEAHKAHGP